MEIQYYDKKTLNADKILNIYKRKIVSAQQQPLTSYISWGGQIF